MKFMKYIFNTSYVSVLLFLSINGMDSSRLGNMLHVASMGNNVEKVKELLNEGVNPDYVHTIFQTTPLHSAAYRGNVEIVQMLLDAGADVNRKQSERGSTPLHKAVYNGQLPVVIALIKAGADVNATDKSGFTPMMAAALGDRIAIGKELLNHGAQLEGTTENWKSKLVNS